MEKYEIISEIISKIENNKVSFEEIENILLPGPVTPEYVSGYCKDERENIFIKLIQSLITKRQKLVTEYLNEKQKLEAIETNLTESSLLKKEEILKNMQMNELKFYDCVNCLHKLYQMKKDPWTPPPLIKYTEELKRVEKINDDIPPFSIFISVGELRYRSSDVYFQIIFNYSEMKILDEYISQNGDNQYDYNVLLKLSKNDYLNLYEKSIRLILYKNKSFWCPYCCFKRNKYLGDLEIRLDDLKCKSEIIGDFELNLIENLGKRDYEQSFLKSTISVSIRIRKSMVEKEFENFVTNTLEIVKILPPFKGIGKYFHPDFKSSFIIDFDQKELTKINAKEISIKIPKENIEECQMIIDPSEFTTRELENPDTIENLNSIYVLIDKLKYYKSKLKNCSVQKEMKYINDIIFKIKAKFLNLQNLISSETIKIDKYIMILNNQIQHDSKLMRYLDNLNEKHKAKLVADRIVILSREVSEAIQYYQRMI